MGIEWKIVEGIKINHDGYNKEVNQTITKKFKSVFLFKQGGRQIMKFKQLIVVFVEILIVSTMIFGAGGLEQAPRAYPTKTIQMIVPATPGGATDVSARLFAQYLSQELGQTVVVVNQDGAGGIIASDRKSVV